MSIPPQRTLASSASLEGTSLHTGAKVTLSMSPAPPNSGILFRRTDLDDRPFIPAIVDNVQQVERSTTIAVGSVKVHTVEHVISALTGMGVDNAIIEMNANEPPIGDGSALPYVECIKKAGIEEQDELCSVFEVRDPIHIEVGNGSLLTVVPDKTFRVSCTQVGPEGKMTQYFSTEINPETYEREIAPARTFVFYEDVEPLLEKGLIKGGSLENAVVVRDNSVLSKEPLRFEDEFARHKILDVVGDLMLAGKRIMGHVICVKPGHGPNTQLARHLKKAFGEIISMTPPVNIPTGEGTLDINEVMQILPHRYPFLLLDRIIKFEGDNKCTGIKSVTINEPFFQGHFPGHPVMPGVLQLEAMAQLSSIMLLRKPENQGKVGYFMSADKVKFRKPVLPGDTLFLEGEALKIKSSVGHAKCRCIVNDQVVSEAELKFSLLSR
jgi:UDP-3-O-[3-hydroxymyristoyl] N-acetylglucosamine deacetylase/3-hydroxyacyl-[acyl-carrier-protein] dehydratase